MGPKNDLGFSPIIDSLKHLLTIAPSKTIMSESEETPAAESQDSLDDHPFKALGLSDKVVRAVANSGYQEPTNIQAQAIPVVLEKRDVIGSSQTGTGKTAAFALPVISNLVKHGKFRCLVLEPTRELADQVNDAFRTYGKYTNLKTALIQGESDSVAKKKFWQTE